MGSPLASPVVVTAPASIRTRPPHSPMPTTRPVPAGREAASATTRRRVAAALLLLPACAGPSMPPAPYVPPAAGTTYDYGDFSNTITGADGWRTTYVDDAGREGRRVALFITEDPRRPLVVQAAALDSLWPLSLNRRAQVQTTQGDEVSTWQFSVVDTATVEVEAGTFRTYVVEGVHVPQLVRDPARASTVIHTWWYAPEANAVVRFQSVYVAGPAKGRRFAGALKAIRAPGDSAVGRTPAAGDSAARPDGAPASPPPAARDSLPRD